jgi:hypothetical protein
MYVLLVIGMVLMLFGALALVKFPEKSGGTVTWHGVEISSTGAGLSLIVLGVVTMTFAAILTNDGLPSLARSGGPTQPTIAPTPAPSLAPVSPLAPARQGVLIGRSENHVAVAIAIKDNHAAGYFCDGNKIEAWLEGAVTGDRVELRGKNGAVLTGTVFTDATFIFGKVTINSEQSSYLAEIAGKPAGLYEGRGKVDGVDNRIGWIVLPDGSQVGIRNVNGERSSAPRLDPDQLKADGLQIPVTPVGGDDDLVPGQ